MLRIRSYQFSGIITCLAIVLLSFNAVDPPEKKLTPHFKNLYKINEQFYRSDQPGRAGIQFLDSLGIKSIINFRHRQTDSKKGKDFSTKLIHYPINTNSINSDDIYQVLKLLRNSPKPVLIHCKHGSDRTGAIVAAFRMIEQNWSANQAIEELRQDQYGYHEGWFPNIVDLLNNLDVNAIRQRLEY